MTIYLKQETVKRKSGKVPKMQIKRLKSFHFMMITILVNSVHCSGQNFSRPSFKGWLVDLL